MKAQIWCRGRTVRVQKRSPKWEATIQSPLRRERQIWQPRLGPIRPPASTA